jgi:hypothetical protein
MAPKKKNSDQIKYDKPRILCIDIDANSVAALRSAGFNVSVGSFGSPSEVPKRGDYIRVSLDTVCLPDIEEQEIVIANNACPPATNRGSITPPGEGVEAIFQSCENGVIDPRPFAMSICGRHCERILNHGGIFIVLLSNRYEVSYLSAIHSNYGSLRTQNTHSSTNWSFLHVLTEMGCESRNGSEITLSWFSVKWNFDLLALAT